ncbi:unnamed protein product [Didymodactylos carnosus]|uniref:Uncharacterized protein n=1 Tax=Didymodactylos carnosus TaxID=1234261 RepID=A0A814I933_9BILA|nr:unnamed protein product [Didymodactylos carnosus]CAF1020400.1 unnamed protein product [Didymodactylos carnosus]CAF3691061.1 unnamed protein product [Didymodactylos carnosus]CAF3791817.1 unnamed protein product [Didymodactylos carnosus]
MRNGCCYCKKPNVEVKAAEVKSNVVEEQEIPNGYISFFAGQDTTRAITIIMKQSKYSYPDTPSNVRALSEEEKVNYVKNKLKGETI